MARPTIKKICTRCGNLKHPNKDYYLSFSQIYKYNDSRFTVCKDCMIDLYNIFREKYNDEKRAIFRLCEMFDICFSNKVFETASEQATKQNSSIAKFYLQKINSLVQYKELTSLDSEKIEIDNQEDCYISEESFVLSKEIVRRWGKDLTEEDYYNLEDFYQKLVNSYETQTPIQEWIYREIAKSTLEAEKCRRSGDRKGYTELLSNISKLMADGNIKPVQNTNTGEEDNNNWSYWVAKIEETEPIGETQENLKDIDNFEKYVNKWFIKPFARVLGLNEKDEEQLIEDVIGDNNEEDSY